VLDAVTPIRSFGQPDTLGRPGVHNWRPFEIEALLELERLDHATEALEEFRRLIPRGGLASAEAEASRLLGLLDEAHGNRQDADVHFAAARRSSVGLTMPLQAGFLEQTDGRRLLRRGQLDEARVALAAAERIFRTLGARPYVERCQAALHSAGLPPVEMTEADFGLTPMELVVARRVAEGLTNREVAGELFVSVKAIEFHLSNIFGKLSIRSRREISRHLDVAVAGAVRR
jgi:DNA-binding CsgD family transcriptional regulator